MRWPQGSPCLIYVELNKPCKQVERYAFRSLITWPIVQIPVDAGHLFRRSAGQHSDAKLDPT
jgi:hypothetical protein